MTILVSDVTQYIQDHGYGSDTSAAQIRAVNAAVQRIWNYRKWPWSFIFGTYGTVNGTATINLNLNTSVEPARIRLKGASDTDFTDLNWLPPQEFISLSEGSVATDRPTTWTYFAQTLYLYPTPNAIYQVQAVIPATPVRVTAGTDNIQIPDSFLEIIGLLAISELAYRERDWNARETAQQEAFQRLHEIAATSGVTGQGPLLTKTSGFYENYDGPIGII